MPNWCEYSLEIKGDPTVIAQLNAVFSVPEDDRRDNPYGDDMTEYDISRAFPCPEELQITALFMDTSEPQDDPEKEALRLQYLSNYEKYGHKDWYHWQIDNWGTKWAPSITQYDCEDTMIYVSGESAWSPPTGLVKHITEQYPVTAIITYQEGGMCFGGAEGYKDGECVYNGYFEYDKVPTISAAMDAYAEVDYQDDAWNDAYERFRDALETEIERHESQAAIALNWTRHTV